MTREDAAGLAEPLSADEPCGPDLDAEGDLDFMQVLAQAEGLLPATFFIRDDEGNLQTFDRAKTWTPIDFPAEAKRLEALLRRSRDLRVLTLLGRLSALNRDLAGVVAILEGVALLLATHWEAVHPRGEGEDFGFRVAVLQALDDTPTVLLPLQHIVLGESRRYGSVTFRSLMVANGEVAAREGEPAADRAGIERILGETDLDTLVARREDFAALLAAADAIAAETVAKGGHDNAVRLDGLAGLAKRVLELLGTALRARNVAVEGAAEEAPAAKDGDAGTPASGGPVTTGEVADIAGATAALAAAGRYLRRSEPSSPAEILVRQAQALVGKSFLDVIRTLVPAHANDAVIAVGSDRALRLTFEQLLDVPQDDSVDDEEAHAASSDADGWGTNGWDAHEASTSEESEASEPAPTHEVTPAPPRFRAATRAEAMRLIGSVGRFYRSAEPSSPIPLLLEKAVGLADRDFLAILKDVLPDLTSNQES